MQKEDNVNNQSEKEKELQQNQSEALPHSDSEQRSMVSNLKMIFYSLIEAASAYQAAYVEQDLAFFTEDLVNETEKNNKLAEEKTPPAGYKKYVHTPAKEAAQARKVKGIILDRKQKAERLQKMLADTKKQLSTEFKMPDDGSFYNYFSRMGLVMEEYIKAKDTGQILMICSMYNQGKFDHVFEELKKEAKTILVPETKILSLEEIQKRDELKQ